MSADNHLYSQVLTGTLDFFTKQEFDPLFDEIQDVLNGIEAFSWSLNSVQHEDDTGYIHYEWAWEMLYG
ncbi:MAG TPA: hypothetical protein PKB13_08380 [Clostridia bacterium]|nr:hypothetical protein [Clostridia bacterium]